MAKKPKSVNSTRLNFRPNVSEANLDPKGTKPTSDPTSIREALTIMILYLCKKSLFYDTNIKIIIYLACLFLLSLIADVSTIPKFYLSRSDNVFNKYFVKFAWGWNLLLIGPFVVLTAYTYCCEQKQRILKHHLLRVVIATFFWWFWTKAFNVIEATFGKCAIKGFNSKGACLHAGHLWNGFDVSGHSFILIYGSLLLIEETRCMINWDSIKEYIRLEEHQRSMKDTSLNTNPLRNLSINDFKNLHTNYVKYTPYIRIIFVVITIFQLLWDLMLISTILYYHIMVEKLLGGLIAILTWFLTYRVWYTYPKLIPSLPGDGAFKYIKEKVTKEQFPSARRRTSLINGSHIPTFMGRPIYPPSPDAPKDGSSR